MTRPVLVAEGLKRYFGNVKAVDYVSFNLHENEILAIVGPNGAGKTTLLNLVSGLIPVEEGRIRVLDRRGDRYIDITNMKARDITRLGIARAFQIPNIFDNLSVEDNLRIGIHSNLKMLLKINKAYSSVDYVEEKVDELLKLFGLEERRDIPASELSHGERKKLDIAIAFTCEPYILLLDEPTAGLTNVEKRDISRVIKFLRHERNISTIFVEHDLDVVKDTADKVIVMHEGRILAYDTPENVVEVPAVVEAYLGGGEI